MMHLGSGPVTLLFFRLVIVRKNKQRNEKLLVSKRTLFHTSIYKSETSCQRCNNVSLLFNLFTYLIVFGFFFCFDLFNTYLYWKGETSQSPEYSIDVIK